MRRSSARTLLGRHNNLADDDPLGTRDLTTHALPLEQAPHGYQIFQKKQDGCIKVVLKP